MEEQKPYNDDDMYDGIENLFEPNIESGESQLDNPSKVIPENIESDDENTYEGITELFEENSETVSRFNDDSIYEGTSELFYVNDDIEEDNNYNLPDDNSNDNISNDDNNSSNATNDNLNAQEDNSNDVTYLEDNSNEQINNHNDDIHRGFSDLSPEEQLHAYHNPGAFARTTEQTREIRRLAYEERIRANITQGDVDADGLNYPGLSDIMLETCDNTIDDYEPDWSDNLYEMSQLLTEIATRRQDLNTNTNPITVVQEVRNMGMAEAYDFMIEMCINVYHLNLPEILG